MNNAQRSMIALYVPLTLLILWFRFLYENQDPALYLMFGVRLTMLLVVFCIVKKFREQKIIALAVFFTVVSDYFFVYAKTFDHEMANRNLFGLIGFVSVYIVLIVAFHRNFKWSIRELLALIPFFGVFTYVFIVLQPYVKGFMYPAALTCGFVLCFAAWTMVCTMFRRYFTKKVAWMIAVAGILLFSGDMFVAFSIFHPDFMQFILWKEIIIWATYMPGWLLLLLVAADERLKYE